MCLEIAINRPDDVLAKGEHLGFEWMVIHNRIGYRCGYVRVPAGHPWYGKDYSLDVDVHGGVTYGGGDVPCDKGGADDGWWLGFDCAHGGDAPDPSLPNKYDDNSVVRDSLMRDLSAFGTVRSQEYVENECRSLCEQAAVAAGLA